MAWENRQGQSPPPAWMADLVTYLETAHGIKPTKELVEQLYPVIVKQWREGATVRETGKATCACNKGKIVPSPAATVHLQRGAMKPPRGAQQGDIFGFDELRTRGDRSGAKPAAATSPPAPTAKAVAPRKPRVAKAKPTSTATEAVPAEAAPTKRKKTQFADNDFGGDDL